VNKIKPKKRTVEEKLQPTAKTTTLEEKLQHQHQPIAVNKQINNINSKKKK